MVVRNKGTEFTSRAIFTWTKDQRIEWPYIMPSRPTQNCYVESFNGKMLDELLNERLFFSLDQARMAVAAWAEDLNTTRPQSTLPYEAPAGFAAKFKCNRLARYVPPDLRMTTCSSTRPTGHRTDQRSKSCWMKVRWQVTRRIDRAMRNIFSQVATIAPSGFNGESAY